MLCNIEALASIRENIANNNNNMWALDANKREKTGFVFSSSGDSLLRDEVISLDEEILWTLDFVVYNDNAFIIPDYSSEHRFCYINHQGKVIGKQGAIPTINEGALQNARPALAQAWRSYRRTW